MASLARALEIGEVLIKDEGFRSNLGSFKALGGGHAVLRLLLAEAERTLGHPVEIAELTGTSLKPLHAGIIVSCATAGNHGRARAREALWLGQDSIVLVVNTEGATDRALYEQLVGAGSDYVPP